MVVIFFYIFLCFFPFKMLTQCLNTHIVMKLGFLCFLCLAGFIGVDGIMFHLEPNSRKCIREEHQANVVMTGEYEVSEAYNQIVDYIVTDSKSHVLSRGEKITRGKFSFVTENFDTSEFCFISKTHQQHPVKHEVSLIIKRGVEAKSYDGVEEAAKLKPMEVELRKLEDLSEEIVKDFSLMRKNEEEMRNTNESTNRRVLYFTVFSMCCLLGLATWQVLYLRSFFKAKKLIE